jgi:hypothetical protein
VNFAISFGLRRLLWVNGLSCGIWIWELVDGTWKVRRRKEMKEHQKEERT